MATLAPLLAVALLVRGGTAAGITGSSIRTFLAPFKGTAITGHSTYDLGCHRSTEKITRAPSLQPATGGVAFAAKAVFRTCPPAYADGSFCGALGSVGPGFKVVTSGVGHATPVWKRASNSLISTHWAANGSRVDSLLVIRIQLNMADVPDHTAANAASATVIRLYHSHTNSPPRQRSPARPSRCAITGVPSTETGTSARLS